MCLPEELAEVEGSHKEVACHTVQTPSAAGGAVHNAMGWPGWQRL